MKKGCDTANLFTNPRDMRVYVQNLYDAGCVQEDWLKKKMETAFLLALQRVAFPHPCAVTVVFMDDNDIRIQNNTHRGMDKATDVLSFSALMMSDGKLCGEIGEDDYEDEDKDDKNDTEKEDEDDSHMPEDAFAGKRVYLGDILISVDTAGKQAKSFGHTPEQEILFLALHGFLHLLGFDHKGYSDNNTDEKMFILQNEILPDETIAFERAEISYANGDVVNHADINWD